MPLYTNRLKTVNKILIFLFPISSYLFYRYIGFNEALLKFVNFSLTAFTILYIWDTLIKKHTCRKYASIIRNIVFLMLFSIITLYFIWGQDPFLSYRITVYNLGIIYFFVLLKAYPDLRYIEKVIFIFFTIYVLLWLYGLYNAPRPVFYGLKESEDEPARGVYRLFIPGNKIVVLYFFYCINKFVTTSNTKWISYAIGVFIIIIMHVTRQIILFSFLIGVYYILRKKISMWIWISLLAIVAIIAPKAITIDENSVLGKLISLTEEQKQSHEENKEDVRVAAFKFYMTEYTTNIIGVIFGNGNSHSASKMGIRDQQIRDKYGFFKSDVGYANIYCNYGIIGLILYFIIFIRAIRQKVPKEYMYAKLFIVYIIFTNFTSAPIFTDVIIVCLSLYVLEYIHSEGCIENAKLKEGK